MTALTTRPFEDIPVDHDWPKDLRALHRAANEAWSLYSNLEDALRSRSSSNARGTLHILAGAAYSLLNDLRGAGISAIWEYERQQLFNQAQAEQKAANEQN